MKEGVCAGYIQSIPYGPEGDQLLSVCTDEAGVGVPWQEMDAGVPAYVEVGSVVGLLQLLAVCVYALVMAWRWRPSVSIARRSAGDSRDVAGRHSSGAAAD